MRSLCGRPHKNALGGEVAPFWLARHAPFGTLGGVPELTLVEAFDPAFISGLDQLPLDGVRSKREQCAELETELSYLRRLAQARIDLIAAELERRKLGGPASQHESIVEHLPEILAENTRTEGPGRLTTLFAPAEGAQASLAARVEAICPPDQLGSLPELSSEHLAKLVERLRDLEREVSSERKALHVVLDKIEEEIVRRYKSGEATVDALLS
jgi:hypothetical protein